MSYVNTLKRLMGGSTIASVVTLTVVVIFAADYMRNNGYSAALVFVISRDLVELAIRLFILVTLNRMNVIALWFVTPIYLCWVLFNFVPSIFYLKDVPITSGLFAIAVLFELIGIYLKYIVFMGVLLPAISGSYGRRLLRMISPKRSFLTLLGVPAHVRPARSVRRVFSISGFVASALAYGLALTFMLMGFNGISGLIDGQVSSTSMGGAIPLSVWDFSVILNLVWVVIAIVLLFISAWISRGARRAWRISLKEMVESDSRSHILFLRPFYDDQITLRRSKLPLLERTFSAERRDQNFDEILLVEGAIRAPVVALGNPADRIQPYGAARGYFEGVEWKDAVSRLASGADAIVICMNDSDNIWWEVDQIEKETRMGRTLFVFRPRHDIKEKLAIIHRLVERMPQLRDFALTSCKPENEQLISSIVGFFVDKDANLQVAVSSSLRHFAYVLLVRWFVRDLDKRIPGQAVPLGQATL